MISWPEVEKRPLFHKDRNLSLVIVLNEETSDAGPIGMEFEADRRNLRDYYLTRGIAVYPTLNRAAKALANVIKYQERFPQRADHSLRPSQN